MKKKNLLTIIITFALAASLTSCGSNDISSVMAENTAKEVLTESIESETLTEEAKTEEILEIEPSTADVQDEPTYKESGCLYMLNNNIGIIATVDMDALEPDGKSYYIVKSIDIYNVDESIAGYTKENVSVSVAASNDEWSYCQFDGYNYLVKTKDLMDSIWVDEKKPTVASSTTSEPVKKEEAPPASATETQKAESTPAVSESVESTPVSEAPVTEQPIVEESNKYTPEETAEIYKNTILAGGIAWDPSIKEFASWGTGFISRIDPVSVAQAELEGIAFANDTRYYFEVTGSDEDYVYITVWGCD